MPITEAALDGMRDNGRRWRYEINLKPMTTALGILNDRRHDGEAPKREETEPLVQKIVAQVRKLAKANAIRNERMANELIMRADDLECCEDCEIEDINIAMNELYDSFDYWRILAS